MANITAKTLPRIEPRLAAAERVLTVFEDGAIVLRGNDSQNYTVRPDIFDLLSPDTQETLRYQVQLWKLRRL